MNTARFMMFVRICLLGVTGASCTEGLLGNSEFALWCGDELCNWKIYEDETGKRYGDVERAPTWHRADDGVALVGPDVRLYQTVVEGLAECVSFTVHADADRDVELFLEVDHLADDVLSPEISLPVPAEDWEISHAEVSIPETVDRVNVIIRKSGLGSAVLASVTAEESKQCAPEMPGVFNPDDTSCGADGGLCR